MTIYRALLYGTIILPLIFLCLGCEEDESKDRLEAAFQADNLAPAPDSVAMLEVEERDSTFIFDINAVEIESGNVYAIMFDINFKSDVLEYISYSEGNFLERSSAQVNYMVSDLSDFNANIGKLRVAVSQVGDTPGATGSGVFIRFEFKVRNEQTSKITFSDNYLFDPDQNRLTNISWYGAQAFGL